MGIRQQLSTKPWLSERGVVAEAHGFVGSTSKVTLWVFLGVVSVLFALFIAAFFIRRAYADWQPIPVPALLWLNTIILIGSSVALQWASVSSRQEQSDGMRLGLYLGGGCAFLFLVGQWLAWRQLSELGYFVDSNPSNAFFYMLTAVHGLHLLGGLVAWLKAIIRVWQGVEIARLRMTVELCAIYWHFLLLIWLVLFGLLLVT